LLELSTVPKKFSRKKPQKLGQDLRILTVRFVRFMIFERRFFSAARAVKQQRGIMSGDIRRFARHLYLTYYIQAVGPDFDTVAALYRRWEIL
jgi:hypothetical protein